MIVSNNWLQRCREYTCHILNDLDVITEFYFYQGGTRSHTLSCFLT